MLSFVFLVVASPQAREAVVESGPAGTTRGEGIKENMSDKHNQHQALMFPFMCLGRTRRTQAELGSRGAAAADE